MKWEKKMEVATGFANTPRQKLRNLLDGVVVAARGDTHAYSGGHLNEANLYKPPELVKIYLIIALM